MGKYTKKRHFYGGTPPTPPPLPKPYIKTPHTLANEEKFERKRAKIEDQMREEEEEEMENRKYDALMEWASRGRTDTVFKPTSKKWQTALSTTKKRKGGKKTRKHKKSRKHK